MPEQKNQYNVVCPSCGRSEEQTFESGLNAARFQQFRAQILDTSYGRIDCPQCQTRFYVEAPFFYTDSSRGQWFACYPPQWETAWQQFVDEAEAMADKAFDPAGLPPIMKNLRAETTVRVVFGIQALREKLICEGAGIDDAALEIFKLAMIQGSDQLAPLLAHRPRCIGAGAEGMVLRFSIHGEVRFAQIPREELVRVTSREEWGPLTETLKNSSYVDLGKLFHPGEDRIEPANA